MNMNMLASTAALTSAEGVVKLIGLICLLVLVVTGVFALMGGGSGK